MDVLSYIGGAGLLAEASLAKRVNHLCLRPLLLVALVGGAGSAARIPMHSLLGQKNSLRLSRGRG